MRNPGLAAAFLVCWAVLFSPAFASRPEESELPERWRVRADAQTGHLLLRVDPAGTTSGKLFEREIGGFLAGRRLVLRRTIDGRSELWEGWLPADRSDGLFLAGTVAVSGPEGTRVGPWYAVPETTAQASGSARAEAIGRPLVAEETEAPDEQTRRSPGPPVEDPSGGQRPTDGWQGWNLSGLWRAADGKVEIDQRGRNLSVVRADGSRHAGRFTATDTLVVGLRKGCCKGKLEGPDVIRWSNGEVWRRLD